MRKKTKNLLMLIHHGPYGSQQNAAALDFLLAAGTQQYNVSTVFGDDGVFALLQNQQAAKINATDYSYNWQALPVYDLEQLYVLEDSLYERNLAMSDLMLFVKPLSQQQLAGLLQQQDFILRY